jgi:putative ABC transport system substrate-binding protein
MITRRRLLVATLAAAFCARAQERSKARIPRVVIAQRASDRGREAYRKAFAEHGFIDGQNVRLEYVEIREAPPDLAESRAREVIASRPDVILMTFGPETMMLKEMTRDIPIVFHNFAHDPAKAGLLESVRRPGGNVTGTYHDWDGILLKSWSLMKEVKPTLKHAAWLLPSEWLEPRMRAVLQQARDAKAAATRTLGIEIVEIVKPEDAPIDDVIEAIRRTGPDAVKTESFPRSTPLQEFLTRSGIISDDLVGVGFDFVEGIQQSIAMTARILRGERPATIPAYKGTRYFVKVNLKVAREMGIVIPPSILVQAKEVIE